MACAECQGIETLLLKGAGTTEADERVIWTLPRTGRVAANIGHLTRRNAYVAEQWSSFLPVVRQIRRFRPHLVFYSDANLGFLLYWFRKYIGVPYRLLFSNGGPVHPPFVRTDFVQQVAPLYYDEALAAGESAEKHFLVPYGINVPPVPPTVCHEAKKALRSKLGLPFDRSIVISVGWIARQHKRMDYVIEEVARLPSPRPFLLLVGAMDESSAELVAMGNRLLGPDSFSAALGAVLRSQRLLSRGRLFRAGVFARRFWPRLSGSADERPAGGCAPQSGYRIRAWRARNSDRFIQGRRTNKGAASGAKPLPDG